MNKTKYVKLIETHGSLDEFTSACEDAFDDGMINWEEKENAIKEYELELRNVIKEDNEPC